MGSGAAFAVAPEHGCRERRSCVPWLHRL